MYSKSIFPLNLSIEELDNYLLNGWFRMGQSLFTTNFLIFNAQLYSVAWLRVGLSNFHLDKKLLKLKKINKNFRVDIHPANITPTHEALFSKYKESVSFDASESLHHLLYHNKNYNIFNTYQVDLFDNDEIIGSGIFDIGDKTAQGITSFFDPAYRKNSLGKYLICLKMEFCQQKGLDHFYPGYFVPGYEPFDYKLELGREAMEFLHLASGTWEKIDTFNVRQTSVQSLWKNLTKAQQIFNKANISTDFLYYPYFSFNLIEELHKKELVDTPMFLKVKTADDNSNQIIVYQVDSRKFQLINYIIELEFENQSISEGNFNKQVIVVDDILLTTSDCKEIITYISELNHLQ